MFSEMMQWAEGLVPVFDGETPIGHLCLIAWKCEEGQGASGWSLGTNETDPERARFEARMGAISTRTSGMVTLIPATDLAEMPEVARA